MVRNEQAKRSFVLEIKGIKPLNSNTTLWDKPTRKKQPLFRLHVEIHTTITDATTGAQIKKISDRKATLRGEQTEQGRRIQVDMTKEIILKPEELAVPADIKDEWSRRKGFAEAYNVLISLNFQGYNDAREFYAQTSSKDSSLGKDPPTRLAMRWKNILECPDGDNVVPLVYDNGDGTSKSLDFGLQIHMYWRCSTDESLLATSNRMLESSQPGAQYPTPPLEETGAKYEITYAYQEETLVRRSLICVHCKRLYWKEIDIDALRLHLEYFHDFFSYRGSMENEVGGIQQWRFECDVADHKADGPRASDKAPDPREIQFLAPKHSFNRRGFLEGNTRVAKLATRPPLLSKVSHGPSTIPIRRENPNEVLARPRAMKKRFKVPKAPSDVVFFRTISKRPLEEGECISESDDDVDTSWVQDKKAAWVNNLRIPQPARRFLVGYDDHVRAERLKTDFHLADALVRFSRTKGTWLWEQQVIAEFRKKLAELLEDELISQQIHNACLKIVEDQEPTKSPVNRKGKGKTRDLADPVLKPPVDGDGDVEMGDADAHAQDIGETQPSVPPRDLCLCGKHADGSSNHKPILYCQDDYCIRHAFHLECVMQQWKPETEPDWRADTWICRECASEYEKQAKGAAVSS
ncbi:hypothetical protein BDV95DRAFT_479710 [Massariosphaeria phaeospora]|uniref:Polycomb protein VEFS-Box domain-containing protein n=1 Tax=Massariosphaeria phaeospora TaxID=100035 RepID=A0A7C8IIC7_9PLEO|nr:hypothetical protein BDV95DRAFT_479710 [Massariosphaeria phaeospora]